MDVISALRQHSEAGAAIVDLLYGDMGSEVSKALVEFGKSVPPTPEQADHRKRRMTAALSTVGATAGAAGLALSGKKFGGAARAAYKAAPHLKTLPRLGHAVVQGAKKEGGSAALFPLEVAGLGGEVMATKILHGDTQKKNNQPKPVIKSVAEVDIMCEISKLDDDKHQVFGWASVTSVNGLPVIDLQDDLLPLEEIEKAAYEFVQKSRIGGNMHQKEETGPIHVSDMIESMVITPEKKKAMGLPDSVPEGWWVGFKVNDDQTWAEAKSGKLAGFSIHGSGRRVPV